MPESAVPSFNDWLIVGLVAWIVGGAIFGILGAWIADQKWRSGSEGFMLGALFGPFGCLIEALLPNGWDRPDHDGR